MEESDLRCYADEDYFACHGKVEMLRSTGDPDLVTLADTIYSLGVSLFEFSSVSAKNAEEFDEWHYYNFECDPESDEEYTRQWLEEYDKTKHPG